MDNSDASFTLATIETLFQRTCSPKVNALRSRHPVDCLLDCNDSLDFSWGFVMVIGFAVGRGDRVVSLFGSLELPFGSPWLAPCVHEVREGRDSDVGDQRLAGERDRTDEKTGVGLRNQAFASSRNRESHSATSPSSLTAAHRERHLGVLDSHGERTVATRPRPSASMSGQP